MHEKTGILTAALVFCLGSVAATAQKDAAQRASEGGVDHWIEYYKAQRENAAARSEPGPSPARQEATRDATAQAGEPGKKPAQK